MYYRKKADILSYIDIINLGVKSISKHKLYAMKEKLSFNVRMLHR